MNTHNWYVVRTKARAEKKVNERLENTNFQTYLPLHTTIKIWSDRKKKVCEPLIPSTLFVYTSHEKLPAIYETPGVSSVLMYLNKPAIVQEHEINNLRIFLNQDTKNELERIETFEKGETVKVIRGPFEGIIATAVTVDKKFRLVLQLESLRTGFYVNVPKSYVKKLIKQQVLISN